MKSRTANPGAGGVDGELSPSVIFDLLAERRRRYALHCLSRRVGAVDLAELAEEVALSAGDSSVEQRERAATGLFHVDIPKLTQAGVVRYDDLLETVELAEAADALEPYLELAAPADVAAGSRPVVR